MLPLALAVASSGALDAPRGVRERAHEVEVELAAPFALFTVTVTLHNDGGRDAEASLWLPLPPGAAACGFEVGRDGRFEASSPRRADDARAVYGDVVHPSSGSVRPVAAAIAVPDGGGVRLRVFPVPADRDVLVRVHAVARLDFAGGGYRFSYPGRVGERLAPAAVRLAGAAPSRALVAARPADPVEIALPGPETAVAVHAGFARGAGVWVSAERAAEPERPVHVVVLVDRSASMMTGERREATARALGRFFTGLPPGSAAAAVTFGPEVIERLSPRDPGALRAVLEDAPGWEAPSSGSDLGAALDATVDLLQVAEGRQGVVVVVTDGRLDRTAAERPVQDAGVPADVPVSALVVAPCVPGGVLAEVVARRGGVIRCDVDRASPGDLDRAVRAVARTTERITVDVGPERVDLAVAPGEQAAAFVRWTGRAAPTVRVASATAYRFAVREVPAARALRAPPAFLWLDARDPWARALLETGRRPAGPPPGSGLPERAAPATRSAHLSAEALRAVLQRSYLPAVRGCFLRHAPSVRAPVSLVVEGRVEEAEADSVAVRGASGALEACLRERARSVLYPWAPGTVRFRYPITYRPSAVGTGTGSGGSGSRAPR